MLSILSRKSLIDLRLSSSGLRVGLSAVSMDSVEQLAFLLLCSWTTSSFCNDSSELPDAGDEDVGVSFKEKFIDGNDWGLSSFG